MIQILGLRTFVPKKDNPEGKSKNYDKLFDVGFEIQTTEELFQRLPEVLEKIPKDEHWNLFYTIANCADGKREFKSTRTIAFDLDGITAQYEDSYIEVTCAALGLKRSEVGIVSSGNGLHFLLQLAHTITEKKFFDNSRAHYKAVCSLINVALDKAGLPGKADTAIFDARRILRLPGTINRKVDKPEKPCTLLQPITVSLDFRLEDISGVPVVKAGDQVDKRIIAKYSKVYPAAVLSGCDFLKHCHASPNAIDEPAWYAALSITARLEGEGSNGAERSHELSRGHKGYTSEETDRKIDQALEASGPRTCEAINNIWGSCAKCPNFGKVTTPLLIRGADAIPTEDSGFHTVIAQQNGNLKHIPNHVDLKRFLEREYKFKTLGDSRRVFVWNGTHYAEMEPASLEAFAMQHFVPPAKMDTVVEFRRQVEIANQKKVEWWETSTNRKMNFKNGYLDIDTLDFRPHDPELAFRQVLPYDYDPLALAPVFEKMLRMVTGNDASVMAVLEEFLGYCLSNDTCWAQKALVLTGEGSNGKSTFIDTLKAVVGSDNYAAVNLGDIDEPYKLAMLDHKLFNISEETKPRALADSSTFKSLVTGQDFTVRLPYKEPFTISNKAKMILTCNTIPESEDTSHGFYRRLIVVDFKEVIKDTHPDYDPMMLDKIQGELPGILNVAMKGLKRLRAQKGFTKSQEINNAVQEILLFNNSVLSWLRENVQVHLNGTCDDHFATMASLYDSYAAHTKAGGARPVTAKKFYYELKKLPQSTWGDHPFASRHRKKKVLPERSLWGLAGLQLYDVN